MAWVDSLRARITVGMLVLVSLSSLLFAFGMYLANEGLETTVLQQVVQHEFTSLAVSSLENPEQARIQSALLQGYVGQHNPAVPAELVSLAPGNYHSFAIGERLYEVLVGDDRGRRIYVAYNITDWEIREHYMIGVLVAGVLLVSIGSIWLGFWSSRQIVAPLTAFAARLQALDPRERNVRIAEHFQDADITGIAESFDRYMERLDGFVEREQSFSSAASHELRTPLTVIQGAADVLDQQRDLPAPAQRAIQRIQRAGREMKEFIEALLFLSREDRAQANNVAGCDMGEIVQQLVQDYRGSLNGKALAIDCQVRGKLILDVAPSLPTIVLSNLLRNAIENSEAGRISIALDERNLVVADAGRGMSEADQARLFDRDFTTKEGAGGMGLYLVKRICDRLGWRIDVQSASGEGTVVRLLFRPSGIQTPIPINAVSSIPTTRLLNR